jgi:hypothetical protein
VTKVQPGAGSDLDDAASETGEHLIAVSGSALGLERRGHTLIEASKDRVVDLRGGTAGHRGPVVVRA